MKKKNSCDEELVILFKQQQAIKYIPLLILWLGPRAE
jgi:hypothetical protein